MFNILFVDTETTGIPRNYRAPITDLNNWPRMVQIAWHQYDATGRKLATASRVIRPDGYSIPRDASDIHRITTARAYREGRDLRAVLGDFAAHVRSSRYLVAHNISFDEKVIGAELIRTQTRCHLDGIEKICTMTTATDFCRLPGKYYGYKWPKLGELHQRLFGEDFEEAHDASVDLKATIRCFWELLRLGVITLERTGRLREPAGHTYLNRGLEPRAVPGRLNF